MDTQGQFEQIMKECRELFAKKLHDYGAAWRIMRPASVTDQIFIKANRIRSLEVKGVSLVGEGIRPELMADVDEKAHFFFVYLLFMFFHCPL